LISGGLQVNLLLPADVSYFGANVLQFELQIGGQFSVPVSISVSQ